MSHTQMLTTRRRKQRAKKHLARIAKQEKKARKKTAKAANLMLQPVSDRT